jgi:hypothetical protein
MGEEEAEAQSSLYSDLGRHVALIDGSCAASQ